MYQPGGEVASTYIKRGLTPFGEFMPLRGIAEFVSPFAKSVVDFKVGEELITHSVSGNQIGPIICYEIINDGLVADMSAQSVGLIVQTNSATFAGTAESQQQLAITRVRAMEFSRSVMSVSTIGISAFIDSNGVVTSQTPENVQTYLFGDLSLNDHLTIANRWGVTIKFLIIAFFIAIGFKSVRRRSSYE